MTNQIRKIYGERCEVCHKMSEIERPTFELGCLSLEYIFSGDCGEHSTVISRCLGSAVLEAKAG